MEISIFNLFTIWVSLRPYWATRELEDLDKRRWGVHGTDRLYEETWFRKSARERGISMEVVYDYFNKHIAECSRRAREYEMTLWDCVFSKLP
jgi:hypothetical protein